MLVVVALVLGFLVWAARRVRRRAGGGSLMNPFDEIWHPIAHHARLTVEVQDELPAPAPLPGDDPPSGSTDHR
ncbi:hypothetical protein GCM10023175_69970 [Pseudonocardia xishanensis]|uniref:Secreted protein n=1 Tax=Pseudonocardia xishanensis TaxID=630995 RepID=A0ABP8S4L9_9PSEU